MIKISLFFWILAWLSIAVGLGFGFLSAYLEVSKSSPVGIYFMVGCALFLTLSGVFATAAAKFQSEKK